MKTSSRLVVALAAVCLGLLSPGSLHAQKALVVCPPSDSAGCDRIAQQLSLTTTSESATFPGGVDRRYTELRAISLAELQSYAVIFVPSLANAPYSLLREDSVKTRLRQVLRGRVAVWSGTPDRGSTTGAGAGKLTLIRNLGRWAVGQWSEGSTGLVVLQDFSDPNPDGSSPRYDWVEGIAGIQVAPDLAVRTYNRVEKNSSNSAAQEVVGPLAYNNMASFGLAAPPTDDRVGAWGGSTPTRGQVVLETFTRSPMGTMTAMSGTPTQLSVTTQPSDTVQNGVDFPRQPVIQLQDASGNAVSQAGVSVTAAIASGGGTLGGTATVSTDASGVATFTNLKITGTTGTRTLGFSASGLTGATSSDIELIAGPPAALSITTQPSSTAQAGVAFGTQPVIQLLDANGLPSPQAGVTITAAIASGGGTLGGTT
ncbi:MAG: hypothetical protein JO040_01955, partial [Gemmatimonadetes bacterium]|nr:hypothetical protein [Gemmatimonadota bacterium]